ncbi:MAG: adenylate kinase [Candidatus Diapherotrites archaeon]|nr:adenylate kinase [Candidatus Diapherotrites archaeon]
MNLVFLGKQGVGKGTYAQRISQKYGLPQVSTGDLCREEAQKPTPLGHEVSKIINQGGLVSDELITQLLERRLGQPDCTDGFILDGYPRNLHQARLLDDLLHRLKKNIDKALLFTADDKILLQRITGRIQCRTCGKIYHVTNLKPKVAGKCDIDGGELYQRDDDKEEAIRRRWSIFEEQTKPIVDYYKKQGLVFEVNAGGEIESIMKSIIAKLDTIKAEVR